MKHLISRVLLGILFGVAVTSLPGANHGRESSKLPRLRKAKVDAARETYQVIWKNYKDGLVPAVEFPYRWSRRWLEAEREMTDAKPDQIAACKAHFERMREMERIERELRRSRLNPVNELTAAEFYRTEAEIWLAQAQEAAGKN